MPARLRHEHRPVPGRATFRRAGARPPFRARVLLTLLAAVWFTPGQQAAHALGLGDIEPRSYLGEPFAARVPLRVAAGDDIGLQCIRILPHPDAANSMRLPPRLRSDIETAGNKQWISIRTPVFVNDLVVGLRVEVDCNGGLARDFVVLLQPAPLDLAAPQAASPPIVRPQPATGMPAAHPAGADANARQRGDDVSAQAPRQATASARTGSTAAPANHVRTKPARDDRHRAAQTPVRKAADTRRADAPAGEFVLRIDAGMLDLSRSEGVTQAQRERLRAMWRITAQGDDGMAAQLELNDRIRQLEESLAMLRSTLEQQAPAAAPVPVTAPVPEPISEEATAMPWLIGATLALLGLAGSFLWWRRRRIDLDTEESWAEEPALPEQLAPDTAATRIFSTAPAAPAAAQHPAAATAPALRQITPPLPPAPPVFTAIAATAPATVRGAGDPPSRQSLNEPLEFSLPAVNPAAAVAAARPPVPPGPPGSPDEERTRAAQEEYFAGRFGAHSQDIKLLHDLDTVVEQARSIYQDDGDPVKAADLLEFTIALQPDAVRLWLALFAIYGRESMARQYALLAHKFTTRFPHDPHWPAVQQLGREIDATNVLYGTHASAGADGAMQQDVTDEWLGVELDFSSSLLAAELHEQLVSAAADGAPPLAATAH